MLTPFSIRLAKTISSWNLGDLCCCFICNMSFSGFVGDFIVPLLQKSQGAKFVGMGSPLGSIGGMEQRPILSTAYGIGKAVQHWILKKIHYEHPELVALVADPG